MSKPEHSPLPWHMENYEEWYDVFPEKGGSIAESANFHNAQFIVTACNAYYDNKQAIAELVEALGQLTAWKAPVEITAPELGGLLNAMYRANDLIAKHKAGA